MSDAEDEMLSAEAERGGVATGMSVRGAVGAGSPKQVHVEAVSNRHSVTSYDFEHETARWYKVKQRIEHQGLNLLALGFAPDAGRGTPHEGVRLLVLSEWQQVLAADRRGAPARWIAARDLIAGQHVLKLGFKHEQGSWAEIEWIKPPPWEAFQNVPVHELVLVGGDSYSVGSVLCRTSSVPEPPPVKKRMVYPLKDFPLINFVPRPKTLSLAQAEVWYRKSAALLPRCIAETPDPIDRVRAMLELKRRMREVAAKAAVETSLRDEFIRKHPLPALDELVPDQAGRPSAELQRIAEDAVRVLQEPGDRRYSEFVGGMESHRVRSETGYWEFDGVQWVQVEDKSL